MTADGHDADCESREVFVVHDGVAYCFHCGGMLTSPPAPWIHPSTHIHPSRGATQ